MVLLSVVVSLDDSRDGLVSDKGGSVNDAPETRGHEDLFQADAVTVVAESRSLLTQRKHNKPDCIGQIRFLLRLLPQLDQCCIRIRKQLINGRPRKW